MIKVSDGAGVVMVAISPQTASHLFNDEITYHEGIALTHSGLSTNTLERVNSLIT